MISLWFDDARDALRDMIAIGETVHAVVTDPPYHLDSIQRRYGYKGAKVALAGSDGRYTRFSQHWLGRDWDGAEDGVKIANDPTFWRLCYDVLPPGGFLVAASHPRTYHRMAVAIEDAGFITHPMLGWIYGQGAPKAHAIVDADIDGWYYGTQALKPALEPIYVGQKPMELTGTLNMRRYGVGGMNIDACRPECGRWPANILHDGSDDVMAAFPITVGQQGNSSASAPSSIAKNVYRPRERTGGHIKRDDSGSAGRFFYAAKPSRQERDGSTHPTIKPQALIRWLVRLVCPPGGIVLDPFAGSGSTGRAALSEGMSAILIEREPDYAYEIARRFGLQLPLSPEIEEMLT